MADDIPFPLFSSQELLDSQDMFGSQELREMDNTDLGLLLGVSKDDTLQGGAPNVVFQMRSNTGAEGVGLGNLDVVLNESDLELSPSFLRGQFSDSEAGGISQMLENGDLMNAQGLIMPTYVQGPQGGVGRLMKKEVLYEPQSEPQPGSSRMVYDVASQVEETNDQVPEVNADDVAVINKILPEQEVVTLENWRGDLNFRVTPSPDAANSKKCMYNENLNKLYVKDTVATPYKFEMDYGRITDELLIRASLVYEDPDHMNKPVLRCTGHVEGERRVTDEKHYERLQHVLRPSSPHSEAKYIQRQSGKCYLLMPLKFPQKGVQYATENFVFTCLSSCKSTCGGEDGINRRPVSIVFCLFDKEGNLKGRSLTHVRICSAPLRDYNKEFKGENGGRKRKSAAASSDDGQEMGPPAIKRIAGNEEDPKALLSLHQLVTAAAREDALSSSQETEYSCEGSDNKIRLRKLIHEVRWTLKLKNSQNPVLRDFSKNIFDTLRLAQGICESARRAFEHLSGKEEGKSPDGGFHEEVGNDVP